MTAKKIFLDAIKEQFKIEKPEDWNVVNLNTIRIKGGQPLLNLYEGSLVKGSIFSSNLFNLLALQTVYTSEDFSALTKLESDEMKKSNQTVITDLKQWTGAESTSPSTPPVDTNTTTTPSAPST